MKSIIKSVQPKMVENILNGKQTILLSKTKPNCELPIKVYIYETKQEFFSELLNGRRVGRNIVVAEFVLDKVDKFSWSVYLSGAISTKLEKSTCLTSNELKNYGKGKFTNSWRELFLWHITDLKIYDKPKELGEFYKPLSEEDLDDGNYSLDCGGEVTCMDYPEGSEYCANCKYGGAKPLTKAPKNWCYVEEIWKEK